MRAPTLAVIGCGAATRDIHLRALSGLADLRVVGLVDVSLEAARELARGRDGVWAASDHRETVGRADAALVVVPPHLHAPIALDLLHAGVHVFVEKPMALAVEDCDRMIEAAAETETVLAVGLHRRFFDSNGLAARLAAGDVFGPVRAFHLSGEGLYPWPMRSAYRYERGHAGGGVLADTGIHYLDLLAWWFGDCERLDYRDDAEGGVEAECHIRLEFAGGASGDVVLSKLREVPSRVRLDFERASLLYEDAGSDPSPRVRLDMAARGWEPDNGGGAAGGLHTQAAWRRSRRWTPHAGSVAAEPPVDSTRRQRGGVLGGAPVGRNEIFRRQLQDFAAAIRDRREPFVPGREGRRSVELLERCYANRKPLRQPWDEPALAAEPA